MLVEAIEPFKRLSGEIVNPGDVLDVPPEKIDGLIARGRVRPLPMSIEPEAASQDAHPSPEHVPGHPTLPGASGTCLKTQNPGHSGNVAWESPLFGRLEAPVLEMGPTHFRLVHPLTGETVTLLNEWLVPMDERSAILEYDAGLPREEADDQAKREFFGLFRKRERT